MWSFLSHREKSLWLKSILNHEEQQYIKILRKWQLIPTPSLWGGEVSDLFCRLKTKHFTCGHKGKVRVRAMSETRHFPLSLQFRPFLLLYKTNPRSSREKIFRKKLLSPSCPVILLLALCFYIVILALLLSTILLPRVQMLLWYLTSLPHSHPSEIVVWIYNPLEPNPLKLWSNCQTTVHQSIRLRTRNISEKPLREWNPFLKNRSRRCRFVKRTEHKAVQCRILLFG